MEDLSPIQNKAEKFFDQFHKKWASQMQCAKGCSHCCIAGLSVFSWEADLIVKWFISLPKQKKAELKKIWNQAPEPFTNVEGRDALPCAFLSSGSCSIYEQRPIICRTQGMSMRWSDDGTPMRDWCPLNFVQEQPSPQDDLNLDSLNSMISSAQQIHNKSTISALETNNERVDLISLKNYLIRITQEEK